MAKLGGLRNSSSPVCVEVLGPAFLNLVVSCVTCAGQVSTMLDLNFTCTNCNAAETLTMTWLISNAESGTNQTLEWSRVTNATWVMFSVAYSTLEATLSSSPVYSITLRGEFIKLCGVLSCHCDIGKPSWRRVDKVWTNNIREMEKQRRPNGRKPGAAWQIITGNEVVQWKKFFELAPNKATWELWYK